MDMGGPAARGGYIKVSTQLFFDRACFVTLISFLATLQVGDMLYEVDGSSAVGLNGQQVKSLILGHPGSPIICEANSICSDAHD